METKQHNIVIFEKSALLTIAAIGGIAYLAFKYKQKCDEVKTLQSKMKELTETKGE